MPAFNQLALYYFGSAKKKAGSGKKFGRTIATNAALAKRGDVQQLELAALVCSQAVRKSQSYAPIHNTSGLILNELGQVNTAVKEFSAAAQLDPHFFEAQMNLAAINLSFRGFDKAEGAYRKALEMHPNDYDAHLGLALALRGQIDDSNYDKQVAAVQSELDTCKKLDEARPDAYFNEGILTQEYKAKSAGDTTRPSPSTSRPRRSSRPSSRRPRARRSTTARSRRPKSGCRTSTTPSPSSRRVDRAHLRRAAPLPRQRRAVLRQPPQPPLAPRPPRPADRRRLLRHRRRPLRRRRRPLPHRNRRSCCEPGNLSTCTCVSASETLW